MKANRVYRLAVRRGSRGPRWLAGPAQTDVVEVVEIETGEVALYWQLAPVEAGRLARALRSDLASLDATSFMARWRRYG